MNTTVEDANTALKEAQSLREIIREAFQQRDININI